MPDDAELLALQDTLYTSSNPTRRWLHISRRDWILQRIQAQVGTCNRALEVGPGSGVFLPALAEVSLSVTASDIEPAYLQRARELATDMPALDCVLDDITDSALEGGSFELILCSEVIEHIADSRPALAGLARLLAPGGRLILTTPQRYSPLEVCAKIAFLPGIIQLVRLFYREPVLKTGHINLLTEGTLREQISDAGLQVEKSEKLAFYLPLVAELGGRTGQRFLAWCERKLRGSRLSGLLWVQCYELTHRRSGR